MAKFTNKILYYTVESIVIATAWLFSFWLRQNLTIAHLGIFYYACISLPVVILLQLCLHACFGIFKSLIRFTSLFELIKLVASYALATITFVAVMFLIGFVHFYPRSVFLLYFMTVVIVGCGYRALVRYLFDYRQDAVKGDQRILLIGGGFAAESLVRDFQRRGRRAHIVGIVDDDVRKIGSEIRGVKVFGAINDTHQWADKLAANMLIIAIPSLSVEKMRDIYRQFETLQLEIATLPGLDDLTCGRVSIENIRPVQIEDLLGRSTHILPLSNIQQRIADKVILVTGAGGSIGSELSRQLADYEFDALLLCDHSESSLYHIEMEIRQQFPHKKVIPLLVDIADERMLGRLIRNYKPNLIIHAAAYKHVPMLEHQAEAACHNNIVGTLNLLKYSVQHGVERFVLVSTDKAVHPTNVMGRTKRVCELLTLYYSNRKQLDAVVIRFGNVLGSMGSVVPLFRRQIEQGGPVTVTDPNITRYFMSIPEAVNLTLKAMTVGRKGHVHVLDMGEPISIKYLAEKMIELSGYVVGKDIEVKFIGLRPGEKLYEELQYDFELSSKMIDEKINCVESSIDFTRFEQQFDQFLPTLYANTDTVAMDLERLVDPVSYRLDTHAASPVIV